MDSKNVADQLKATQEQKQKQSVDNVESFKNFKLKYPGVVEALDDLYDGEYDADEDGKFDTPEDKEKYQGLQKIDVLNEKFQSDTYKTAPNVHLCTRLDSSKIIDNGPETKTSKGNDQISYKTDLLKYDAGGRKVNVDLQTFIIYADIIDGKFGPVLKLIYSEDNKCDMFLNKAFEAITEQCRNIVIFRNVVTGRTDVEKRTRADMMVGSPVYEQTDDNGNVIAGVPKSTLVKPLDYANQKSNMVPAIGQGTGKTVSPVTRIPFNDLIGVRIAAQFNIHVHSLYITSGAAKIQLHLRSAVIFRIMESVGGSVSVDAQMNFLSGIVTGFTNVNLSIPAQISSAASSSKDEKSLQNEAINIHIPTKPGENTVSHEQSSTMAYAYSQQMHPNQSTQMNPQMHPGFVQPSGFIQPPGFVQPAQMQYQQSSSFQPQSPNMTGLPGNSSGKDQREEIMAFLSKGPQ